MTPDKGRELAGQRQGGAAPEVADAPVATRRDAMRSAFGSLRSGERLIIAAYVASQFADRTLFTVGGFVVSAQKLIVLVLLPLGAVMIRRIIISRQLVALAALAAIAFSVSDLVSGRENPTLAGGLLSIVLNCVAAVVVTSALASRAGDSLRFFASTWVILSAGTAILAVGQMLGLLPLVADAAANLDARETASGLVRGTGLKNDPNFAAMLLLVGLIFCYYTWRGRTRLLGVLVITLGVAATLSRMGVLIACAVLVLAAGPTISLKQAPGRKLARVGAAALAVLLAGLAALFLSPGAVRLYLAERVDDLAATFQTLVLGAEPALAPGQVNIGSGVERADLSRAALDVFLDHWIVGVGANDVPAAIGRLTGMPAPAHNTYVETLAVGGIFGLALLVYYATCVVRLVRTGFRRDRENSVHSLERQSVLRATRLVIIVVALMAVVLTFDYIAFFWLPIILAIGLEAAGMAEPAVSS
jgi:hypothetical protein